MTKTNKKKILSCLLILTVISIIMFLFPSQAYAEYMNIDVGGVFDANTNSGSASNPTETPLWDGLVSIVQTVTTAIILPLGIIMSTWRVLYLAIFCFIAGVDPLKMKESGRYNENSGGDNTRLSRSFGVKASITDPFDNYGGNDKQQQKYEGKSTAWSAMYKSKNIQFSAAENEKTKRCLLIEVKHLFLGLFITFAVWTLIQIAIWIAVIVLQVAGGFA